jgi:hypothetical protein
MGRGLSDLEKTCYEMAKRDGFITVNRVCYEYYGAIFYVRSQVTAAHRAIRRLMKRGLLEHSVVRGAYCPALFVAGGAMRLACGPPLLTVDQPIGVETYPSPPTVVVGGRLSTPEVRRELSAAELPPDLVEALGPIDPVGAQRLAAIPKDRFEACLRARRDQRPLDLSSASLGRKLKR